MSGKVWGDITYPFLNLRNHMSSKMWDKITYPFLNFKSVTIEVLEWISNFIPLFMMDVITYPCWD